MEEQVQKQRRETAGAFRGTTNNFLSLNEWSTNEERDEHDTSNLSK